MRATKRALPGTITSFIVDGEVFHVYDPIVVHVTDYGMGRGDVVFACYNMAWAASFGNTGTRSTLEFVGTCSVEYLLGKMRGEFQTESKRHRDYQSRVVMAVQSALAAERGKPKTCDSHIPGHNSSRCALDSGHVGDCDDERRS